MNRWRGRGHRFVTEGIDGMTVWKGFAGGVTYAAKVLSYGPIAYWPLWEATGTTAVCQVNPLQNGTYNSDVSTWPPAAGIGDGNTAPTFDAVNDCVDIYSATLRAAFDGQLGSAMIWIKARDGAVWTDGLISRMLRVRVNNSNYIDIREAAGGSRIIWLYVAGGVSNSYIKTPVVSANWLALGITWSAAADEVKCYYYDSGVGGQEGATMNGLGVWAGLLDPTTVIIGAQTLAPVNAWDGFAAHVAVWDSVLSLADFNDLAVV